MADAFGAAAKLYSLRSPSPADPEAGMPGLGLRSRSLAQEIMNASPGALGKGSRRSGVAITAPVPGAAFNRSRRPRVHSAALRLTRYVSWR